MDDRSTKQKMFRDAGWGMTMAGRAIFDFLYSASKKVGEHDVVLDLGAGQCRYRFFFEHAHYVAVDFAQGDSRWDYSQLDICADICRLPYIKSSSVEFCLNTVTLEHINEPHQFIREVFRVLKPGGTLFLYVPFAAEEHQIPYDFFRYTSYGLRHMAETAGFADIRITPSNSAAHTAEIYTYMAVSRCRTRRKFSLAGLNRQVLRKLLRWMVFPMMRHLDRGSESGMSWPSCWMMEARKPGSPTTQPRNDDRNALLDELVCCPECGSALTRSASGISCGNCRKAYPVADRQISFMASGV